MRSLRGRLPYILATCLLLVGVVAFFAVSYLVRVWPELTGASAKIGPAIVVEASYPGANAQVVADTVAAPIEQQIDGVEGMVSMSSQCTNDGDYRLTVTFRPRTDLNMAQVLVQNRVSLALPVLPAEVQRQGVTVRKQSPHPLLFVMLSSPDGRFDELYLSNYADIYVKDELARLPGVGAVSGLGGRGYGVRVRVDPGRLAVSHLTALDVVKALEKEGDAAPRPNNKGALFIPRPRDRALDLERLADLVLRADADGRTVRLRDVARLELGAANEDSHAAFDGKPVVLLGVYPLPDARPRAVSTAVRDTLTLLREHLPAGLDLTVPFDFTPNWEVVGRPSNPEYLLLDLDLPAGVSVQRTQEMLKECDTLLRETVGVQHALTLTENPFDHAPHSPCILAALEPGRKEPGREQIIAGIRKQLGEVKGLTVRVRDLSGGDGFPRCGYPIDFAVRGPDLQPVQKMAAKLAERLRQSGRLTDGAQARGSHPERQLFLDVDRGKAAALGVALDDIFNTLQLSLGSLAVNDFNGFGRTWQVRVQIGEDAANQAEDVGKLEVKNNQGQRIRLSELVASKGTEAPATVTRLDMRPMVEITANPAAGVSLAEARTLCTDLAEEVRQELGLSNDYGLTWLEDGAAR
jgi:multidrug efflux pump subunit AcrB